MKKSILVFTLVCAIFTAQFLGIGLQTVTAADLTPVVIRDTNGDITSIIYPNPVIENFITGLALNKISPDETEDLGSNVPQNGEFRMTYSFSIPRNSGLLDEDYFYLDLPDYVHVPSEVTNIEIRDSVYNIHVCTVNMLMGSSTPSNEDAILIEFTPDLESETANYAFTGEFWFEANFDEDAVGEGGNITIEFENGRASSPYNIDVDFVSDPPVPPTLVKSNSRYWNSAEHRHYYTWTLDFNQENADLGLGVIITDPLPLSNTEMQYITGSLTQTRGSAAYTSNYDLATHTLEIEFTDEITDRQTLTFQTAFYNDIYMNYLDNVEYIINVSNQAAAETVFGNILSNTSTRNYSIDVINKSDTNIDLINRKITWRIEANPNNYIVNGAYVTDDLPEGLTMDESTIEFYYSDGVTPAPGSWSVDDNGTPDLNDDEYTFLLGDITEEILIIFVTDIDPDLYYTQDNDNFTNQAFFHPPAVSTSGNRASHTVPVSTDVLQKSTTSIDISDGVITWQLIINPNTNSTNKVQLADVVVTDPIPNNIDTSPATSNNGLVYVPGSLNVNIDIESEVTGASAYYDSTGNQIVVDFDPDGIKDGTDIIESKYIITYQTKIADDYIYKVNSDSSVTNTASFISYNAGTASDSASRSIEPDVLQKSFVSYDYDTHYFKWHININSIETDLENALITDYISENMKYVEGTFEIFDSSSAEYSGGIFSYAEHDPVKLNPVTGLENISGTIEYQFPAIITDSYDIYFETEYVDLEQLSDNHLNLSTDYLEANNTVYLVHDDLPPANNVSITAGERFTSSIIEKDFNYTSGNQFIDWIVTINKNQIDILGPNPDPYPDNSFNGPVIYDTLQEGLVIDLESIKLYDAVVNSDNTIDTDPDNDGNENIVSFDSGQVTYDANTRQLTFEFANDIYTCYKMTFRTYIEAGYNRVDFANTASFHALAGNDTNTSANENVLFATGGGYAAANIGHLLIKKVDAESNTPLQGALFELLDSNGTVVDVKETDASGEALFEFIFFDRDYWYREVQPPYGYSADTATAVHFMIDSITATDQGDDDPDRTYAPDAIKNTANPVTVQFYKYDGNGIGLQGALFYIYESGIPDIIVGEAVSDINGVVSFNNLAANRTYEIVEIMPPLGYLPDPSNPPVLTVICTVGSIPFEPTPNSLTNISDDTAFSTVIFMKYAQDGSSPMGDCVFGLYNRIVPDFLLTTAVSQENGMVEFTNIPAGTYIIRELSAPEGYLISSEELTVTVGDTANVYWTDPDSLINHLVPPDNPQTGDNTKSYMNIFLLTILLTGLLVTVFYIGSRKSMKQ